MADLATDQTIVYNAIPTQIGLTKIQLAMTTGQDLVLATMGFGDGGGTTPTPSPDQTSLVNQLGSVDILGHEEDLEDNVTWYSSIIEAGTATGVIREIGLFDRNGKLCFVGNIPDIVLPEPAEGVLINIPIQLGIKNYYSKYISIKSHIKVIEQIEGSGGYSLFDIVQKDHVLSYDESEGFGLQGTWVYSQGSVQEYYGYPDFIDKCIEEKNDPNTVPRRITLGDETIVGYVNPNGHIYYNVADKSKVDAYFEQYGIAWFYCLDEANRKVFLPRNNFFFKNSINNPGNHNLATLPSLAHSHVVSLNSAGDHEHSITIENSGEHLHTLIIDSAGSHNHTMQSAGGHTHNTNGSSSDDDGGSYFTSGNVKNQQTLQTQSSGAHTHTINDSGTHTHTGTIELSGIHAHNASSSEDGAHTHTGTANNTEIVPSNLLGDTVTPPSSNMVLYIVVGNVRRRAAMVINELVEQGIERIEEVTEASVERIEEVVDQAVEVAIEEAVEEAKEEINTLAEEVEERISSDVEEAREYSEVAKTQAEISEYWAHISIEGQIQSDWAETDPQAKSYIRNKPVIDLNKIVYTDTQQTLTHKTINCTNNSISNIGFSSFASGLIKTSINQSTASNTTLATSKAIIDAINASLTNINVKFNNLDSSLITTYLDSTTASQTTLATSKATLDAINALPIANMEISTDISDISKVSNESLPTSLAVYTAIAQSASTGDIHLIGKDGVSIDTTLNTIVHVDCSNENVVVESSYTGTQGQPGTLIYNFTYVSTSGGGDPHWEDEYGNLVILADYDLSIVSGTPQIDDTITLTYITTSTTEIGLDPQTITSSDKAPTDSSTSVANTKFTRVLQTYQPISTSSNSNIVLQDDISVYVVTSNISSGTTFTFNSSNLTYLSNSVFYTFELKFNMTSLTTITFPGNVVWQEDEVPDISEIGNYLFVFRTIDGGTTWIGNLQGFWR